MSRTKVFRCGNSQAVRIPREFQLDTTQVEIFRNGDDLIIRKPPRDLARAFELLTQLSSDFFQRGRRQPKTDKRPDL